MSPSPRQITNTVELYEVIAELELKAARQKEEMLTSFEGVKESLKPMNLLKQTVQSTFSSSKNNDLVGTALGLGSGLLGRRLLFGRSGGILGKLLGAAVEFGLGGIVAKNADRIKEKGSELIDRFLPKRKQSSAPNPVKRSVRPDSLNGRPAPSGHTIPVPDPEAPTANFFPKN